MSIHCYSRKEEWANSLSHGIGLVAAIVGLVLMLIKAIPSLDAAGLAAISVYGGSLILMFLASTVYHAIQHPPSKAWLKRLDHCAIYLLIAGTYTPYLLITINSRFSWLLFAVIWLCAGLGVLAKSVFMQRFAKLSLLSYLAMGWMAVFIVPSLYSQLHGGGFLLLVLGGLCYSGGAVFYAWKSLKYGHAIWHLFVLAGAVLHCVSIAVYVIPQWVDPSRVPSSFGLS